MIQVRNGTFETNSSSVHLLIIPKECNIKIPPKVFLVFKEYGWSSDVEDQALNYVYQACVDQGKEELNKFFDYLKRKGIQEIYSPELKWKTDDDDGYTYVENNDGYVDHSGEVPLDYLFTNESLLDRFVFGGGWVVTGNDNSENCPSADSYDKNKYDILEKGN